MGLFSGIGNMFGDIVGDLTGANQAADAQRDAANLGIGEQRRQFDLTRGDLLPYMQAGTNALSQYTGQMNNQPGIPTLQGFTGQAVNAPNLQRFTQQSPQANALQSFNPNNPAQAFSFDVNQAMNSPELQFQQQMGQQQLDRTAGANRNLRSGQRMLDAVKFGQGLASQSIGDQFNRQLAGNQAFNQAQAQNFGQGASANQINNANALNAFNMANQNFANNMNAAQFNNQVGAQQFGMNRENLGDLMNLYNLNNQTQMTNYGLQNEAYQNRLNRLAGLIDVGRGTGTALGGFGANTANQIAQGYQNIGNANAAQSMSGFNTLMDIGQLAVGAKKAGFF